MKGSWSILKNKEKEYCFLMMDPFIKDISKVDKLQEKDAFMREEEMFSMDYGKGDSLQGMKMLSATLRLEAFFKRVFLVKTILLKPNDIHNTIE